MITAISKDGSIKREVVYNEVILMVDKYDSLTFRAINDNFGMDMTFNFKFSDSGKRFSSDGKITDEGKVVTLTLNNWYSRFRIENIKPLEIDLKLGKKIWVKFGTSAQERESLRIFYLTIWGEVSHE